MRRPIALGFLVFFLLFLAEGGLHGGIAMVLDPSRGTLEMTEVLPSPPVPDYTLPAQFVLVAMGAVPLGLAYGLRARPAWARAERCRGRGVTTGRGEAPWRCASC